MKQNFTIILQHSLFLMFLTAINFNTHNLLTQYRFTLLYNQLHLL